MKLRRNGSGRRLWFEEGERKVSVEGNIFQQSFFHGFF